MKISQQLIDLLEEKYLQYNQPNFIENDPIVIPHRFSKKQDIEIAGFMAAILAWGQRKTIINKCSDLLERMDNAPHDFILNHSENDLKIFEGFKHRTFNTTDTLYFIDFFKRHYETNNSLETAFLFPEKNNEFLKNKLINFHDYFCDSSYFPARTRKHLASPARKSTCKRLVMFLRWMVRSDDRGVDFGLWKTIQPSELICPCDVHVERVSRKLGLIERKQTDWQMAEELTENLKKLDANDPVKYDFSLFGLGIEHSF